MSLCIYVPVHIRDVFGGLKLLVSVNIFLIFVSLLFCYTSFKDAQKLTKKFNMIFITFEILYTISKFK
jgi:hypothetical protein